MHKKLKTIKNIVQFIKLIIFNLISDVVTYKSIIVKKVLLSSNWKALETVNSCVLNSDQIFSNPQHTLGVSLALIGIKFLKEMLKSGEWYLTASTVQGRS